MQYHTLESHVSSDIQTPQNWLKNLAIASFFNSLLSVWISDETLHLVYDILHQITTFTIGILTFEQNHKQKVF